MRESSSEAYARLALADRSRSPKYIVGHSINIGALGLTIVFIVITMMYQSWENGKRARGERDYRLAKGDAGLLGFHHPHFRYTI